VNNSILCILQLPIYPKAYLGDRVVNRFWILNFGFWIDPDHKGTGLDDLRWLQSLKPLCVYVPLYEAHLCKAYSIASLSAMMEDCEILQQ
jgi:hypothetical protein